MRCRKNRGCNNLDNNLYKMVVQNVVREEIERQQRANWDNLLDGKLQKVITNAIIEATSYQEAEKQKKSRILTTILSVTVALWYAALFAVTGAGAIVLIDWYPKFGEILVLNSVDEVLRTAISVLIIFIIAMLILLAATMLMSAIKMFKEKDRDFLMSSLANVVGMTALIIAFIALFLGGK